MIGSITSGLTDKDNLKELAIARALALTPFVGLIGKCYFYSSGLAVKTYNNLSRKVASQFYDHAVISGKPVPEYVGGQLEEYNYEIVLHASLGVEPLTEIKLLNAMVDSGEAYNVFNHGKSEGKWTIRSMEYEVTHWGKGRPAVINVSLVLKEYVESLPVQAQMKLRQEELKMGDTGLGGPERLGGTASVDASQVRELTPIGDASILEAIGG
ncbi:MAG: phage tail protein [Candidatus Cloacimonetes bacterium]|nr:phage tail protein [Candidatus Cloacimonadota bacterium]